MVNGLTDFICYIKRPKRLREKKFLTALIEISNLGKKRLISLVLMITFFNNAVSSFLHKSDGAIVFAVEKGALSHYNNMDKQEQSVEEASKEIKADSECEKQLTEESEFYDTTEAEISYGLAFLEHLPKRGEEGFDYFLALPEFSTLKPDRKEILKIKDGSTREININEQEIYHQIETTVGKIIKKVDDRTPISKHSNRSRNLRIAKAIYRWVAKNISYDIDSITDSGIRRKPQDAFFVYNMKMGVCLGYAQLSDIMLKIAGVPSSWIATIRTKKGYRHGFNMVYVEDDISGQTGWTLFDPTLASYKFSKNHFSNHELREEHERFVDKKKFFFKNIIQWLNYTLGSGTEYEEEPAQEQKNIIDDSFHTYFPSFYNTNNTLAENNKNFLKKRHHKIGGFLRFNIHIDGVYFCLTGCETHSCIEVLSPYKENFFIPEELSNFKIPFRIGVGIKSLILNSDEKIDLNDSIDLEEIDTTHSTRYFWEGNKLYERKQNGKLIEVNICEDAPIVQSCKDIKIA